MLEVDSGYSIPRCCQRLHARYPGITATNTSAQPRLPLGREAASAGPAARSSVSSECNVAHDLEAPPTARADEATGSPPQPLTARSLSEWRGFE